MRRILLTAAALFILASTVPLQAQPNRQLIAQLNEIALFEIRSLQQCEEDSEQFGLAMPYHKIISEKEETVKILSDILERFGNALENKRLPLEKYSSLLQALNSDAQDQISLVCRYDDFLDRFGHPEICRVVLRARRQALVHFMLLSTMAQKIIIENRELKHQ